MTSLDPHIWQTVQAVFAEALGFDEDEIGHDAKVIDDLEAESIDLLDILYRLDQAFGIKIPRGGIEVGRAGAKNASWLAAKIMAVSDPELRVKLSEKKDQMREKVLNDDRSLGL